jgi:hypothetical protein
MYQKPKKKGKKKMCGNTWNARNQSGKSHIKKSQIKKEGRDDKGKKKVAKNV